MIKMLVLVCSLGMPEAHCLSGSTLVTANGPAFESAMACRIQGLLMQGDPDIIEITHRIEPSSVVHFLCVEEA